MDEIILSTNISSKNDLSKMTDDEKAKQVAKCLKRIKRVKLNCWIKANGAKFLSDAINDRNTPVSFNA